MPEHNMKDEQIHDLTMFILGKINYQYTPGHSTAPVIADEVLRKYNEIFNRIKNQRAKFRSTSNQS